jgi:hypothetical protein
MICVLQIEGTSLESGIAKHLAVPFYRKDISARGRELLFYDVADKDERSEFLKELRRFIDQNRSAFAYAVNNRAEISLMNLDFGIMFSEALSRTLLLDKELIALLGQLEVSVSISAYRSDGAHPDGGKPSNDDRGPSRLPQAGDPPLPRGPNVPAP